LNILAVVYHSQGEYEEAIRLHKLALLIGEKTMGKEHPSYALRLSTLANVYKSQGKYDEALPMYEVALQICVKYLGENHPSTQEVKKNLEACRILSKK
jgi:tetratricopeptide (TPR) repeat protein